MVQPFSKQSLRIISCLFRLSFMRQSVKRDIRKYHSDVLNGRKFFEHKIQGIYSSWSNECENLTDLYALAVNFRSNKKLVKSVFDNFFTTPELLIIFATPFCLPFFLFKLKFGFWTYLLIYILTFSVGLIIGVIIVSILDFIGNFQVKIGKALTRTIQLMIIGSICTSTYFVFCIEEGIIKGVFLSVCGIMYLLFVFLIIEYLLTQILVDAFYFSRKIQITDALIIESSYRLSNVDWIEAIKKKNLRQNTLNEIERLATLIEKDWSNHILAGDEKTNRWKQATLVGIATSLRKLKRQLIIPASDTPTILKEKFDFIFEKLLKHDLQGLIDSDVPATRIRKKSKLRALKSVLVAVLPVSIAVSINVFVPTLVSPVYIHITIAISGLWLLVCTLLWLDPNLAEKIATIKSVRSMLKNDDN